MERVVDQPRESSDGYANIDLLTMSEIATRLDAVTRIHLLGALEQIPGSWPVTDEELEAVGYFLERRSPQVAARIRNRIGVAP